MVGERRFELPTSWSRTKRATRLRYSPSTEDRKASGVSRKEINQYKCIKSHYVRRNRPSLHPSPQRGEGRVRGPHVKEINTFVLLRYKK